MDYEKLSEDLGGEDAAAILLSGKSSPATLLTCGKVDVRSNYVALELESAQLELQAAEAMKRAANAKRRASAALRADRLARVAEEVDDVPVDDEISVKLLFAEEKVTTRMLRYPCIAIRIHSTRGPVRIW
ncbi:unnamed protein product [Echinostoma caproni]|uniref:Kinesin motor domain-containing protein n=1 Tax=Echinostoma caproni TaxID=27848 RepID=A0A183AMB7_9TREM|nr:unnamed protein product [Echinostoma caproni]